MTDDDILTTTRTLVSCPDCEYRRVFAAADRRVGGAVSGHTRSDDCAGTPVVTTEEVLVCESCGYADGEADADVRPTQTDDRYPETTLCGVCRRHRDQAISAAIGCVLDDAEVRTDD